MSLYTDGPVITPAFLQAMDPSVADVSSASKLPVAGAMGVIQLAWTELSLDLIEWLESLTGTIYAGSGLLIDSGLYAANRDRFLLNQVVTTGQWAGLPSPLTHYAARKALVFFWQEAVRRSKDGDRFEKKWEMAQADLRRAKRAVWANGIPISLNPLSAPGAQFDPNSGSWTSLNVTVGPHTGTLTQATSIDVAITWVDQSVYVSAAQPNNGESGPSQIISTLFQPGFSVQPNINGLRPPGRLPYLAGNADGIHYARNATGWNVYANVTGSPLVLQNSSPLSLSTLSYELLAVITAGQPMGIGQVADINHRPSRTFSRG